LTWVYDAILDDLVFPAEIVGKRIRVKLDGKQILKVHLDKTQQTNIEHKVNNITNKLNILISELGARILSLKNVSLLEIIITI